MASRSLGQLTIDLIAKTGGFEQGMERAQRTAQRAGRNIARDAEQSAAKLGQIWSGAATAIAAQLAAVFSVAAVMRYADAYTELQNRLRLVTATTEGLAQATGDVFSIAMRTAQSVDSIAQVYQRFAQNAESLGLNLQDVADLTTTVAQAVAVSGASAASAQAALVQFGQALASGVLRGEELNSVMEQTPGLARAIADGLGIPIGQLRQLAADGKITSDALVTALRRAAQGVSEQFGTRVLTVGQAVENLNTAALKVVGAFDQSTGASSSLANAIDKLAQRVGDLSEDMEGLQRDADAVREIAARMSDFFDKFAEGISISSKRISGIFADSFADSFLATAKEIDTISADFQGFFGGVYRAVTALGLNIQNAFANTFDAVIENAASFANTLIDKLSAVSEFFGGGKLEKLEYQGRSDRQIYSLVDSYVEGYKEAARGLGAYEALSAGIADRAITRAADAAEQAYKEITERIGPTGTAEGKKKKEQLTELQRLVQQLQFQAATLGMTAEQAERYRIATAKGSEADRVQALALFDKIQAWKEEDKAIKQAAESTRYFAAINRELEIFWRRQNLDVLGIGMGDRQRELFEQELAIRQEYAERRRQLEEAQQVESTKLTEGQYQRRIADLEDAEKRQIEILRDAARRKLEAESIWLNGVTAGLQNYVDEANNAAASVRDSVQSAFKGMEDSLANFVQTGKLNFSDLVNSIVADLARIAVKQSITGPLASAFANLFGGLASSPFGAIDTGGWFQYANGGVFGGASLSRYSNRVYNTPQVFEFAKGVGIFAEAGPEAIMPLSRGPDGKLGVRADLSGVGPSTAAPQVNIINQTSQPIQTADANVRHDGERWVVDVVLKDLKANGPIRRQLAAL